MAIYFDGDNSSARSRIDYGDLFNFDNIDGLQDWTCAIKIKLATAISGMAGLANPIIGKVESGHGWELTGRRLGGIDKIRFHTSRFGHPSMDIDSDDFSDTSDWHTILITSEQISPPVQTLSLFVDDMDTAVATGDGSGISDSGTLTIGSRPGLGIDANLAHAAIWSGILTPTQRNEILTDDPRTVSPSSLLFYSSYERGTSGVDCRNLVTDIEPSGGVQFLTMEAERPSDFWPLVFGLRHGASDGSFGNQTFFVFPSRKTISSAIIEIDEADTFDSDGGFPQFSISGSIGSGTNYCWAPEATGLSTSTLYYYRLKLEDEIVPTPDRTFTSWTSSTSGSSGTFVVASCSRFEDAITPFARRDQDVIELIRADNPDFFVGIDDSIYAEAGFHGDAWVDSVSGTNPHTRDFSENFGSHKNYVQLHEQFPCIYGLGDHEQNQDTDKMWKDAIRIGGNGGSQAPKYLWVNTTGEEYACTLNPTSGDPGFSGIPTSVFMVSGVADQGTIFPPPALSGAIGTLASGEWGWGLYNGFNTIHIRMYNGTDPENYLRNIFATASDLDPIDGISQEYKNSYEVMRNWFFPGNPTPIPGTPSSPGDPLYFTFEYGPGFTFFVLDERTQRDANNPEQFDASDASPPMLQSTNPSKTILGQQQEDDLFEWLDNPANHYKLKIILSPNSLQKDVTNSDDGWGQLFTQDLARLKRLLTFKQNVVIMAGDTHYKTAARFRTGGKETEIHAWDLWELCASPIDSSPLQDPVSPGNEIAGVPNSHSSGAGDGYNQVYMRVNSSYSGTIPSFNVEYVDVTGVVQYTSNTFTWTDPGESLDLFVEGVGFRNDNIPLFIKGLSLDTDIINLFTQGHVPVNDNIPLYIKGKRLDFLDPSDVLYYHPMDSLEEYLKEINWEESSGTAEFIPSILASGAQPSGAGTAFVFSQDTSSGYVDLSGALSFTCAVLTSGFFDPTTFTSVMIGFANSSFVIQNGVVIRYNASDEIDFIIQLNSSGSIPITVPVAAISGWSLIVCDGRYESDLWISRLSINGDPWINLGSVNVGTGLLESNPKTYIRSQKTDADKLVIDEVIIWKDSPLFKFQELENLYELANTHGQTMNFYSTVFSPIVSDDIPLYINGRVSVSDDVPLYTNGLVSINDNISLYTNSHTSFYGSIDLFTEGYEVSSDNLDLFIDSHLTNDNQIDLFIRGPRGDTGILQGPNAIFYLNCDNVPLHETIENKTWTDFGGALPEDPPSFTNASGAVVSGITPITEDKDFITAYSGNYPDITGSSGLCFALWTRGDYIDQAWFIRVGFGSSADEFVDNGLLVSNSIFETSYRLYASGSLSTYVTVTRGFLLPDPSFLIVDIRYSGGTTWIVRDSVNGDNWSDAQPITISVQLESDTYLKIYFDSVGEDNVLDEIILWSNNLLFTERELSNLYELANTHNSPMPSYSGTYGEFIESSGDLFTWGVVLISGQTDSFIHGFDQIDDNTTLYTQGHSLTNNNVPFYMNGYIPVSGNPDLFIFGNANIVLSGDLFIRGHNSDSGDTPLYTLGHISANDSLDLFVKVHDSFSASGDLFVKGHNPFAVSGDLFIEGLSTITISGDMPLFAEGIGSISGSVDLFITSVNLINNDITLYIMGVTSVSGQTDLFTNGFAATDDDTPLYINGLSSTFGELDLYIEGPTEASGIQVSGDLFINGLSQTSGQADLFIVSFASESGNVSLYTNGFGSTSDNMTLFINNFVIASGDCDLYLLGSKSTDNNVALYTNGIGTASISDSIPLIINGLEPKDALSCPTLDPTASIQIPDTLIKIYQSRIDALINQLGKNIYLEFDPIRDPCINCTFDTIRKRSTGIYISGGPRPFARGRKCPYCKSRGFIETSVNKCIKCLIKWNPNEAEKFGISVERTKGIVRFKTFLTEADDIRRAKTAISNHDIIDQMVMRVKLIRGPIPVGLREDRYCISFWELM